MADAVEPSPPAEEPSPPAGETAETNDASEAVPAASDGPPRVLLTGATTFIGTHILNELMNGGKYRVRAVEARLTKENILKNLCPKARYPVEVVKADIWDEAAWPALLSDCTYIIHTVNKFLACRRLSLPESDCVSCVVQGTLNILKGAKAAGTIKRVVMTGSLAAVTGLISNSTKKIYTESDWPDNKEDLPVKLKCEMQTEMESWKYVRKFPKGQCFDLTVVHPAFTMGPLLSKAVSPGRLAPHRQLLEHEIDRVPNVNLPLVDVRDVAIAHINALTAPGAANKRHLLTGDNISYTQTAQILSDEFSKFGYNVPTKKAGSMYMWFGVNFSGNSNFRRMRPVVNKEFKFDNTSMKNVLGVTPRPTATTLIDMGYSMIETGLVKKTSKFIGRKSV